MSLIQFLRILLARRWVIIVATLACFIVAAGVASMLPKRYEGTARVMLDVVKPDPVTGQGIATTMMRGYINTQIQLIADEKVTGAVVDRLNLVNDPGFLAAYQNSGGTDLEGGIRRWIARQIGANTSAKLVEGSNILEITYQGPEPELARNVAGLLRDAFIEQSLRLRTDSAGRTGEWYTQQAERAQRALAAAEQAKTNFMRANNLVVQGGVELEQQKLANLENALVSARSGANTQEAFAVARTAGSDPVVEQLRVQMSTLEDQIVQAGERLGPNHPTYQALLQRRATLNGLIARAQRQSQTNVSATVGATRQSLAQLQADVAAQRAKVLGMKGTLDQLDQLQREVDLRRDQYQRAAARSAELRLEADVSETGLVPLNEPVANPSPVWPKVPLIAGLALFFGLGFGVLMAILIELAARRVRGAEDLSYATGAPVLAVVSDRPTSRLSARVAQWLSRKRDNGQSIDDGELQAAE